MQSKTSSYFCPSLSHESGCRSRDTEPKTRALFLIDRPIDQSASRSRTAEIWQTSSVGDALSCTLYSWDFSTYNSQVSSVCWHTKEARWCNSKTSLHSAERLHYWRNYAMTATKAWLRVQNCKITLKCNNGQNLLNVCAFFHILTF